MTYVRQCYVHNGPAEGTPCMAKYCVELREWEMPDTPLFGKVPGGANDTIAFERETEQGMKEYGRARANGLRPVSTKKGGVEKTERLMESQARALTKLDGETDISKIATHPGVK